MKHTPGPWKCNVNDKDEYDDMAVYSINDEWIASVIFNSERQEEEIAEANANLVAAAPKLLDACEAAREYIWGITKPGDDTSVLKELIIIIGKARGK